MKVVNRLRMPTDTSGAGTANRTGEEAIRSSSSVPGIRICATTLRPGDGGHRTYPSNG